MNVFVVYKGYDYEGEKVVRIFDTEEDAEEMVRRIKGHGDYQDFWIHRVYTHTDPDKFNDEYLDRQKQQL
jgi:hypothetical protein